jgi:two-component system, OmpR family, response regulator ResD
MRILIADDDDMVRLVIREILRGKGHALEEVGNGEQAVQKSAESKFDLILLDYHMPGLSGAEAARQIRTQSSVRIILLTGSARPDEDLDGFPVLRKPFAASELLSAL